MESTVRATHSPQTFWLSTLSFLFLSIVFLGCTPPPAPLLCTQLNCGSSESCVDGRCETTTSPTPATPKSPSGSTVEPKGDPSATPSGGEKTPDNPKETPTEPEPETKPEPPTPTSYRWSKVIQEGNADLLGVTMPTATDAWVVGHNGTILFSSDAGATWSRQNSGVTSTLRAVWFVDSKKGWAVGDNGVILFTKNGGATWKSQPSLVTDNLYAVQFVSSYNGWAVGDAFTLLRTTDGGESWQSVSGVLNIDLRGIAFKDKQHGYFVGAQGTILHTYNGALSVSTEVTGTQTNFRDASINSQDTWAVGAQGQLLLKTQDSGWQKQESPVATDLNSIRFLDDKRGWMIGAGGVLLGTKDGGTSWSSEAQGSYPDLHAIAAFSDKAAIIVGANGTIVRMEGVYE
ncbi:MAG: hypothetical protein EP343_24155 [Deltaproteobacteria bacterium]|nr:MAG: hypothetical protein EP343_24155 [Deltaproteobacteria bacterium]